MPHPAVCGLDVLQSKDDAFKAGKTKLFKVRMGVILMIVGQDGNR